MNHRYFASGPGYRTTLATFLIGLGLGIAARGISTSAHAQVMDPGGQRMAANEGIAQLNAKMDDLLSLLRSGTFKVELIEADKTSKAAQGAADGPGRVLWLQNVASRPSVQQ